MESTLWRPARTGSGAAGTAGWAAGIDRLLREASGNRTIVAMIALAGAASFFVGTAFQAQMPSMRMTWDRSRRSFVQRVVGSGCGRCVYWRDLVGESFVAAGSSANRDGADDVVESRHLRVCADG